MAEPTEKQALLLNRVQGWKFQSENMRSSYDDRWTRNMKLIKGRIPEDEAQRSKVRKRSKIFFRKTWAVIWRLMAAMYQAFLRDTDNFKIEGRDTITDPHRAKVLQYMVEWRRDWLMRHKSLFIKLIWAFKNIADLGWCCGKLVWEYNPDTGTDGPNFILYPNEQVYPDFSAETPDAMRYIIFENFMTKEDMKEYGYQNIEEAEATSVPSNIVRQTRQADGPDPLQNPGENEYLKPGAYTGENRADSMPARYRVWEIFYKEEGKVMMAVTNGSKCVLKDPEESAYDEFPDIQGLCLTEAHKLMGEGFPEPLEGPQESINAILNQRKDNIALGLNPMYHVSRYGNVDLASLVNSRAAGIVLMDDLDSVKTQDFPDVTQSAYAEAAADEAMMHEMSGVTPGKMGLGQETKATVAQINLTESNAKVDLFIAIVAETFMRNFFTKLAHYIQRFETDETVFRIANERLAIDETGYDPGVYDLGFEADLIMHVGLSNSGRETEIQKLMLGMDRATMHNQMAAGLLQSGMALPPGGVRMVDTTVLLEEFMMKMGHKDFKRLFFTVPTQANMGGGGMAPGIAGRIQPQIGNTNISALPDGGEGY